jgi:hypothetical protein
VPSIADRGGQGAKRANASGDATNAVFAAVGYNFRSFISLLRIPHAIAGRGKGRPAGLAIVFFRVTDSTSRISHSGLYNRQSSRRRKKS